MVPFSRDTPEGNLFNRIFCVTSTKDSSSSSERDHWQESIRLLTLRLVLFVGTIALLIIAIQNYFLAGRVSWADLANALFLIVAYWLIMRFPPLAPQTGVAGHGLFFP